MAEDGLHLLHDLTVGIYFSEEEFFSLYLQVSGHEHKGGTSGCNLSSGFYKKMLRSGAVVNSSHKLAVQKNIECVIAGMLKPWQTLHKEYT